MPKRMTEEELIKVMLPLKVAKSHDFFDTLHTFLSIVIGIIAIYFGDYQDGENIRYMALSHVHL